MVFFSVILFCSIFMTWCMCGLWVARLVMRSFIATEAPWWILGLNFKGGGREKTRKFKFPAIFIRRNSVHIHRNSITSTNLHTIISANDWPRVEAGSTYLMQMLCFHCFRGGIGIYDICTNTYWVVTIVHGVWCMVHGAWYMCLSYCIMLYPVAC